MCPEQYPSSGIASGRIQMPRISPLLVDVGCSCSPSSRRWPRDPGYLQGRICPQHSVDFQCFQSENHWASSPLNFHSSIMFKLACFQSWHLLLVFSIAKRTLTVRRSCKQHQHFGKPPARSANTTTRDTRVVATSSVEEFSSKLS